MGEPRPGFLDYFSRVDELLQLTYTIQTQNLALLQEIKNVLVELRQPSTLSPTHFEGSVGTTPQELTDTSAQDFVTILIHNTHAANTLYASFDATHWKKIDAGSAITLSGLNNTKIHLNRPLTLKGSASTTTYEIIMLA